MTPRMMLRSSLPLISFLTIFSTGLCIEPGTTKCRDEWHAAKNDPSTQIGKQWQAMQAQPQLGIRQAKNQLDWMVESYYALNNRDGVSEKNWGGSAFALDVFLNQAHEFRKIAPSYDNSAFYSVEKNELPRLFELVDEASTAMQIKTPLVMVYDNPSFFNAFVLGGKKLESSIMVVSTGLLDLLDDAELRGVLAHECAHLRQSHTVKRFAAIGGGILVYVGAGLAANYLIKRYGLTGYKRTMLSLGLPMGSIVLMLLTGARWIRSQEHEADHLAATQLPDSVGGLISGLEKMRNEVSRISGAVTAHSQELRKQVENDESAPTYLKNKIAILLNMQDQKMKAIADHSKDKLTHPSFDERIKRLKSIQLASELAA